MPNLTPEKFVRQHIRHILNDLLVEQDEDKKKTVQTKVLGGGGKGGRYPKELLALFGGESVPDLLSRKDPSKLMSRLRISVAPGSDDFEKIESLIQQGVSGREEMQNVYVNTEARDDGKGRKGIYIITKDISTSSGRLFLREMMLAAVTAGKIKLSGHVRVEIAENGVIIYPVATESERWGT